MSNDRIWDHKIQWIAYQEFYFKSKICNLNQILFESLKYFCDLFKYNNSYKIAFKFNYLEFT